MLESNLHGEIINGWILFWNKNIKSYRFYILNLTPYLYLYIFLNALSNILPQVLKLYLSLVICAINLLSNFLTFLIADIMSSMVLHLNPVTPSMTVSVNPPKLDVITGVPQSIDSTHELLKGSIYSDGAIIQYAFFNKSFLSFPLTGGLYITFVLLNTL